MTPLLKDSPNAELMNPSRLPIIASVLRNAELLLLEVAQNSCLLACSVGFT